MLAAAQILPVFTVRPDVYSPGGRSDGHPGLQVDVPRSSPALRTGPAAVQFPLAGRARLLAATGA